MGHRETMYVRRRQDGWIGRDPHGRYGVGVAVASGAGCGAARHQDGNERERDEKADIRH
jgi:hypothetical protein